MALKDSLSRYKPAVVRSKLFILAGVLWSVAGVILFQFSIRWLLAIEVQQEIILALAGLLLAAVFYRWGFRSIVKKNIARLHTLPERPCVFAFASVRSYLLIAVMMTMGIMLRNSSIPKYDLAVPYEAMGGALFLGSLQYFLSWRALILHKD